jgi:hypothetical protein
VGSSHEHENRPDGRRGRRYRGGGVDDATQIARALQVDEHQRPATTTFELPAVSMAVAVGGAIAGCDDLREGNETTGRVSLSVHDVGARDIGALVDDVRIDEDTVANHEFTQRLRASAALADMGVPDRPLEGTFRGHYTVGSTPDTMTRFVDGNPDLVRLHPIFAQLADRDGPPDDDLASAFAHALDDNPDLAQRFEQFIIEDGLELSKIPAE